MAPKGRKRKAEAPLAKTATSEGVEMNVAEESPKKPKKDEELGFRVIIEHWCVPACYLHHLTKDGIHGLFHAFCFLEGIPG